MYVYIEAKTPNTRDAMIDATVVQSPSWPAHVVHYRFMVFFNMSPLILLGFSKTTRMCGAVLVN